jgi:hypothetical protein
MATCKEKLNLSELSNRLELPNHFIQGMLLSGLFGYTDKNGNIYKSAIESYEKYGTQWNFLEGRDYDYSIMPEVNGWENAPIGTFTEMQISLDRDFKEQDTHWIAQLYIKPNKFFFADPENKTLVGSCSIMLKERTQITSEDFPEQILTLYPHPDGSLALVSVIGKKNEKDISPLDLAMKMALPILSELAFRSDKSIHISQKHWIGLPSGIIHVETYKRPDRYEFNLDDFKDYHSLREAKSLYFTALNCSEPMSQFLSFYRVIELTRTIANEYLQKTRKTHKIPNHSAYGSYQGKKVNQGVDILKKDFRNSIAHANTDDKVISEHSRDEYNKMVLTLPVVRFIAKEYIYIIECNLKATDLNYSKENNI